jgi:autotransporter-associated beta strand protein
VTISLTGDSFAGGTAISNGTVVLGAANAIGSGNLSLTAAGTLELAGNSQSVNGLSGSGTIDNNGAAATLTTASGGTGLWSGTISGGTSGGVCWINNGTNTLVVSGTNYLNSTAASEVQNGTLIITNHGVVNLASAEFWIAGNAAATGAVVVAGGNLTVSNWLVVARDNVAANGTLTVNSGTVQKAGANNIVIGSLGGTGTLIVNGGQVLNNGNLWLGEGATALAALYLNGGLVQATQVRENNSGGYPSTAGVAYFNGGILQATAASVNFITNVSCQVMSNGLVLDDGGFALGIGADETLQAGDGYNGGVVKQGAGTVYFDDANYYGGTTLVTNGTLAGVGAFNGPMVVAPAGTLGAGDAGTNIGTLTINNNLTLQGHTALRISLTGGTTNQDNITVNGSVTYGGVLNVSNITSDATALAVGDTFQLFTVSGTPTGNFTSIVGPAGATVSFDPSTGVLTVTAVAATLSGLQFTAGPVIFGTTLTITATNAGAGTVYLLSSTNLTTPFLNWTPVWTNVLSGSGSWSTNLHGLVNPAAGQQFYRLSTNP